ncbi:MAG: M24 family metallopeptidase [Actinobacteria bacterium]|nr:M24 family metallopeptidase [Actinomycetota bacterium]
MIELDAPGIVEARQRRMDVAMGKLGIDGWLFTTSHAVRFATGAWSPLVDLEGETSSPIAGACGTLIYPSLPRDDPRLIDELADSLPARGRIAVDRLGLQCLSRLHRIKPLLEVVDASVMLTMAANPKTGQEIAIMEKALHSTEEAFVATIPMVRESLTERRLSGIFYEQALRCGLSEIHVDTVFSVLPKDRSDSAWARGEWSWHYPYRELTGERRLESDDVVAFDAGFRLDGYASDLGCMLYLGKEPAPAMLALAESWTEVANRVVEAIRPGASAKTLREAALNGWPASSPPPWPYPLYVVHGIGTEVAEPPFAGADLAPGEEDAMRVEEGQVLMVEPYVFVSGVGGFRAEYCVAVEAKGARILNGLDVTRWYGPSMD